MNNSLRIIKKYPNRRLYDTNLSTYITLDDVKTLVLNHTQFQIIDTRTEEDVTNYILLQIISEQENRGTPIFSNALLQNIIRFYGNAMQGAISEYLERGIALVAEQQNNVRNQLEKLWLTSNPLEMATQFTQKNLALWQSTLDQFAKKENKSNLRKKTSTKNVPKSSKTKTSKPLTRKNT